MKMNNDSGICGIYKITKKDTGQIYIGLSENIEDRWYNHIHSPSLKHSYIDRAIYKHGEDKFYLEIIEEVPNNRHLLMEREAYWVAHYNTYEDDFHYNLTPGGDFNPAKVPEIAEKYQNQYLDVNIPQNPEKKCQRQNLARITLCMVRNTHQKPKKRCQVLKILLDIFVLAKKRH